MGKPATPEEYLATLPEDRRVALTAVREVVNANLPDGYVEGMQYGMIGWYVPLETYPDTYNGQPLGLASLGNQKNHMALYLMCVYGDDTLRSWFEAAWRETGKKLDMGKSCVRFRRLEDVPLELVGEAIAQADLASFLAKVEAAQSKSPTKKKKTPAKTKRSPAKAKKRPKKA